MSCGLYGVKDTVPPYPNRSFIPMGFSEARHFSILFSHARFESIHSGLGKHKNRSLAFLASTMAKDRMVSSRELGRKPPLSAVGLRYAQSPSPRRFPALTGELFGRSRDAIWTIMIRVFALPVIYLDFRSWATLLPRFLALLSASESFLTSPASSPTPIAP